MTGFRRAIAEWRRRVFSAVKRYLRAHLPASAIAYLKLIRDTPRHVAALRRSSPAARLEAARHELDRLARRPTISLVMPTYRTETRYLREAVDSVLAQVYPEWELRIVDDGSEDPELSRALAECSALDPRIRVEEMGRNGGISAASNRGLEICEGEFVGFLDHDDVLTPDALLRIAQALAAEPELDVVYSDSDKLTAHGARADPFLKPDWSPVYALGAMYIGHLLVVRRSLAGAVGGFDSAFDKIQDFEFMLRVSERSDRIAHVPEVLYHWRAIPGSIAAGAEEKSGVAELQARAVSAHLKRRGIAAVPVPHPRIPHRALLEPRDGAAGASVSVVVAAREGGATLSRLLESLGTQARAPAEVIVASPGGGAGAGLDGVRAIDSGEAFHRARANNAGAAAASGELLLFVAEDCALTDPEGIAKLALHAGLPGVGAVAPRLERPDGRVEQAGFAIGLADVVSPLAPGVDGEGDGYYGSLPCAHEVSALSVECMLVRRADFERAGAFNEAYAGQFEDFDLCRRLAANGLACVYAPVAAISHRLPATRRGEVDIVDRALFVDCWYDDLLRGDPYFNPGFGRERADYSPASWRELARRRAGRR